MKLAVIAPTSIPSRRANTVQVMKMSQAFAKERIRNGKKGKIINTASLMSDVVRKDNSPYAASKGGIRQLTKALAIDWAPYVKVP